MALTYEERIDMRRMMKRVIGGSPYKYPENYKVRTPLHRLQDINCPVLIIHGSQDKNVSLRHSILLEEGLKKHGRMVESWYFSEYTHYFPPCVNRQTVKKLSLWMKEHGRR